jgi:ComF family protein
MRPLLSHEGVLVPVPTTTSRVRQRGYDQAKLLARQLSRLTGLSYQDCLVREGRTHQVGANRQQRQQQMKQAFRVKPKCPSRSQHIILVDDVLTTGATLESAAQTLRARGYKRVSAIVFAQA